MATDGRKERHEAEECSRIFEPAEPTEHRLVILSVVTLDAKAKREKNVG